MLWAVRHNVPVGKWHCNGTGRSQHITPLQHSQPTGCHAPRNDMVKALAPLPACERGVTG
jgi:hypothetical protein